MKNTMNIERFGCSHLSCSAYKQIATRYEVKS